MYLKRGSYLSIKRSNTFLCFDLYWSKTKITSGFFVKSSEASKDNPNLSMPKFCNSYILHIRNVSAGTTSVAVVAPKFSDMYLNPIPTKGGRFCPPSQRLQLTFPCGYVPVCLSKSCACLFITLLYIQSYDRKKDICLRPYSISTT